MPWPSPLARSGNFRAPKKISTMPRINRTCHPPKNAAANRFIYQHSMLLEWGCKGANKLDSGARSALAANWNQRLLLEYVLKSGFADGVRRTAKAGRAPDL